VGRLRGYGNALVAPQAAAFVGAVMEALDMRAESGPMLAAMGAA
jgi:hypothetical protein